MNRFSDRRERAPRVVLSGDDGFVNPSGDIVSDRADLLARLGITSLPARMPDQMVTQMLALPDDAERFNFLIAKFGPPSAFRTEAERTAWIAANPWYAPPGVPAAISPVIPCPTPPAFAGPTAETDRNVWLNANVGCAAPELDSHVCPVIPANADAAWYAAHPACTPPTGPTRTIVPASGMTAVQGLLVGIGIAGAIWWVSKQPKTESKRNNPRRKRARWWY